MTLGSLLFELGFIDKGVGTGLDKVERKAVKTALGLGAINAALYAMMATAAAAGQVLAQFTIATGLSADGLQLWQQRAAAAGVSGEELAGQIKRLQDEATAFKLGEPRNVGVWSLLGVDPRADPFTVLDRLHVALRGIRDVAVARELAGRVGIGENVLQVLLGDDAQYYSARRSLVLEREQIVALNELGKSWKVFVQTITNAKNQLGAALAPTFEVILRGLTSVARGLTLFAKWLSSGSIAANVFRYGLVALTVVVALLGVLFAALAAVMSVGTIAAGAFAAVIAPLVIAFGAFAAVLALVVGGFVALGLMLQDFSTAATGGKSLFDWNDGLLLTVKNVERLAHAIEFLIETWDKFSSSTAGQRIGNLMAMGTPGVGMPFNPALWMSGGAGGASAGSSVRQENNVEINVHGSTDSRATGKATADAFQNVLNNAGRQIPVPNY